MAEQWHAGRTVGRTLYRGDGPEDLIGVMDSRELAALVVTAVNVCRSLLAKLDEAEQPGRGAVAVGAGSVIHRDLRAAFDAVEPQ